MPGIRGGGEEHVTVPRGERSKRGPSRVHRPAVVLRELRRLRVKVEASYDRAVAIEEKAWCRAVADALDTLVLAGDAVLPPFLDPRPARLARKRPVAVKLL